MRAILRITTSKQTSAGQHDTGDGHDGYTNMVMLESNGDTYTANGVQGMTFEDIEDLNLQITRGTAQKDEDAQLPINHRALFCKF